VSPHLSRTVLGRTRKARARGCFRHCGGPDPALPVAKARRLLSSIAGLCKGRPRSTCGPWGDPNCPALMADYRSSAYSPPMAQAVFRTPAPLRSRAVGAFPWADSHRMPLGRGELRRGNRERPVRPWVENLAETWRHTGRTRITNFMADPCEIWVSPHGGGLGGGGGGGEKGEPTSNLLVTTPIRPRPTVPGKALTTPQLCPAARR